MEDYHLVGPFATCMNIESKMDSTILNSLRPQKRKKRSRSRETCIERKSKACRRKSKKEKKKKEENSAEEIKDSVSINENNCSLKNPIRCSLRNQKRCSSWKATGARRKKSRSLSSRWKCPRDKPQVVNIYLC